MSRSTPVCFLRCTPCKQQQDKRDFLKDQRYLTREYLNVMVIGRKGDGAICQCRTCGYKYVSRSDAALRLLWRWEKEHADSMLAK